MTTLHDPFPQTHKKPLKDKQGNTVGELDYIQWSQAADRLDEVAAGWSFVIVHIGPDWVHGRLTIGEAHYENIGYAENAEAAWKKEVLKDATSDAFKRCAALAGVGRYLYDRDVESPAASAGRVPSSSRPASRPTVVREGPDDPFGEFAPIGGKSAPAEIPTDDCPIHGVPWNGEPGDLWHKGPEGYCRHPENVRKARRA